jgi:hypothetical protein
LHSLRLILRIRISSYFVTFVPFVVNLFLSSQHFAFREIANRFAR